MEESKRLLEAEFTKFLIEKIKNAGGSLPFHQLSGLLYSARFEVRDEFGTKKKLMSFLRAHSNLFNIDSSSRVTVNLSSSSANDSLNNNDDFYGKEKEPVTKTIDCGIGKIIKLHPEYGIIRAFEPLETNVYFKSDAFSGNKDILLIDTCLHLGCEVNFNAVYGHEDCDIKFRANKVWLNLDTNTNFDITENEKEISDDLTGEGIIQKISSCQGFILASGKDKKIVFFDKKSVKDCKGMELENYFRIGECVSFSASRTNERNSKYQWEANLVRKKSNDNVQSSSHSKTKPAVKNRIANEAGKIYPHSRGATIKFGSNELADGNSSSYFLCGFKTEISDIVYEFDEGDDIFFDAIKTESAPGWKALLVWKGDKPEVKNKIYSSGEMHEISDNDDASYQRSNSKNLKSKSLKSESNTPKVQSKSNELDHAVCSKMIQPDLECKNKKFKTNGSSQNSDRKSNWKRKVKNKKELKKDILINENKDSYNKTSLETKVIHKSNLNSKLNKLGSTLQSSTKVDNISDCSDENDDDFCYKNAEFSTSEKSFSSDEFPGILQNGKHLIQERYNDIISSASQDDSDENDTDNEIEQCKSSTQEKSSIKKFEDIEGEIVRLYCKAAIIGSSHLQKNIDFVLNMFYVDGKSVEEQQVIDLKEIIKVGDCVNFNCFEIIDDFGEIYHKVTVVWKGPKPNVYEMTPQEFIDQYHLSVTISDEIISKHLSDKQNASQNSLVDINSFEETDVLQKDKNLIKECNKSLASASHHNFVDSDENDNTNNQIKQCNNSMEKRPSIQKFEGIKGEIIKLYCKVAKIECSHLQKNVDFVLTMFYVDGKSVEEQQVIDLKEILKVGDCVNFNCFEIIDDFGEIHQKVTVVWKGPKPNVYEMTPQEFIDEGHLSVTMSDELVSKHLRDKQKVAQNSVKDLYSFEEAALTGDDSSVVLLDSKDQFGNKMLQQLNIVETEEQKDNNLSDHVHELLSQRIMNRLKEKGLIFTDLKIDLSDVLAQIIHLVQEYNSVNRMKKNKEVITQVVCSTCSEKNSPVLSCIRKNHAAVQTIITGAIIAQSIYTQN